MWLINISGFCTYVFRSLWFYLCKNCQIVLKLKVGFFWANTILSSIVCRWWTILPIRKVTMYLFSSVRISHSVLSDSLRPHGLQHTRLPCPSTTPGACSNSCLSSWWCHPTISSSVIPFSSCLQSFPASGSFPMNWFFASGGQSIRTSASASVLPMNIQDWFPLGWTDWIALQSKGLSRVFSNTTIQMH